MLSQIRYDVLKLIWILFQETWVRNWFVLNESFLTEVEAPRIEEHQALRKEALLHRLSSTAPNNGILSGNLPDAGFKNHATVR